MSAPLVSILMPIYNCSDFSRGNGKVLLNHALDSWLAQTYPNFEILLLDNQSTDRTPEICAEYARRDSRVKFMVDTEKRSIDAAFAYLPSIMNGKYCCGANDDDRYHPRFLERLVSHLEQNPHVDVVYPNCDFIDINDGTLKSRVVEAHDAYYGLSSPLENFCFYAFKRNPLPIIFALFRAEAYKAVQPTVAFDRWGANVDNFLNLKLFLNNLHLDFIDETLFYYRMKERPLRTKDGSRKGFPSDFPEFSEPIQVWIYYVRHQLNFADAVFAEIRRLQSFSDLEEALVSAVMREAFVHHSFSLLDWIAKDEMEVDDHLNRCRLAQIKDFARLHLANYNAAQGSLKPGDIDSIRDNPFYVLCRLAAARERIGAFTDLIEYTMRLLWIKTPLVFEVIKRLRCTPARWDPQIRGKVGMDAGMSL